MNEATPRTSGEDQAPAHPFEVRISIGGDDWEYVVRTINELAEHISIHGPECSRMSGGGGSHSVTIFTRDISAADFRKELDDCWKRQRAAKTREASAP